MQLVIMLAGDPGLEGRHVERERLQLKEAGALGRGAGVVCVLRRL